MQKGKTEKKMTSNHKNMLRRRGLNPEDYVVAKETYSTLYLRNIHTGKIKPIVKCN